MGRLSDAVVHDVLDALFGNQPTAIAATYYVGLSTTAPTGIGGGVTEPVGGGYVRIAVPNNTTNWNTSAARKTSNKTAIVFPAATGNWGMITHFVLWRTATGTAAADFAGFGELDVPIAVNAGGTLDFPPGALIVDAPGV